MNINIVLVTGQGKAVADHCEGSTMGEELQDSINFVDSGIYNPKGKCVNVSSKSLKYNLMKDEFDAAVLGLEKKPTATLLFTMFNGKDFGAFLEIYNAPHFMNGGIGPNIGTGRAIGLAVETDIPSALPKISIIKKFLTDINYHGEVLLGVSEDFCLTSLDLGHFPTFFGMFVEASRYPIREIIEFAWGSFGECELYSSIILGTMISLPSFPSVYGQKEKIRAVRGAEKHMWRLPIVNVEPAFVTVHGSSFRQANQRFLDTVYNIKKSHPDLQYRTDCGRDAKFVLVSNYAESFAVKQQREQEHLHQSERVSPPSVAPEHETV